MKMAKTLTIFTFLVLLLVARHSAASVIDAPHNNTNKITCAACHSYSLWWTYSPIAVTASDYQAEINTICLTCHDGSGSLPMAITHSSLAMGFFHRQALNDWSEGCTDCHDPHFQLQRDWEVTLPNDLYLVTGGIASGSITHQLDGSTDFNYINATADTNWQLPSTWGAKSTADRGLIMTVSDGNGISSYEVISATETLPNQGTMKVQGSIDIIYDAASFYLMYGQLIKSQIQTPMGPRNVKLFDPAGTVGAFVDQSAAPIKEGVCQVCHTQTNHFRFDGSGPDPNHTNIWQPVTRKCSTCHMHDHAFGHAADGGSECSSCHVSGKHVSMLNLEIDCSTCHNLTMRDAGGNLTLDVATSPACDNCHIDGAGGLPNQTDMRIGWNNGVYDLDCNGCHSSPPAYLSGTPKANSHISHPIHCNSCHYTTTGNPSLSITGFISHTNGIMDVNPAPTTDFSYVYDAGGSTCNNITCHGGNAATWGASITQTCQDCHVSTTDLDDHSQANGVGGVISQSQWMSTGHGRVTGLYPVSGYVGAGLTCEYCHSSTHFDAGNPYQLVNTQIDGQNGNCLICHKTGSTGYDPGTGLKNSSLTARVDSYHYGAKHETTANGGLFCWDCHDPHGDANLYMIHDEVSKQTDNTYGLPAETGPVVFTANLTGSDYAKSVAPFDGICNACHTTTDHYRTDTGNQHRSSQKCTICHFHNGTSVPTGFEPQATFFQISGRLMRLDNVTGQASTLLTIKEKSGQPYKDIYTDANGYWSTLLVDNCYDIFPAQNYRYQTYYSPLSKEVCLENLNVTFDPDHPPAAPVLVNELNHSNLGDTPTINVLLEWQPVLDPPTNGPVQYYYEITHNNIIQEAGFTTSTSVQFVANASTSYNWRVLAEDAVFPGRMGPYSAEDNFFIYWGNATCPDPAACSTTENDF